MYIGNQRQEFEEWYMVHIWNVHKTLPVMSVHMVVFSFCIFFLPWIRLILLAVTWYPGIFEICLDIL
jgi:hypothetical protein